MKQTIVFNNGTEEVTLTILTINKGISGGTREALIFNISKETQTEEEIRSLLDNVGIARFRPVWPPMPGTIASGRS